MAEQQTAEAAEVNPRALFRQLVAERQPSPVLEIGTLQAMPGRSVHRMAWFPHIDRQNYVMADAAPGSDVDEVCNIHSLPVLWTQRFGAFLALSVFEKLERPWIACREVFKILRPGGLCYVATHQSFPIHNLPKDFFRFSRGALELIFADAGFRILASGYEERCAIVPPPTTLPANIVEQWNDNHPSYIHVHLVASKPGPA